MNSLFAHVQAIAKAMLFPSVGWNFGKLKIHISNEAGFHIESPDPPSTGIPSAVLKRCFGKQRPIAPHCQRLLVAARKEIKAPAPKAKAKAKAKAKGGGKGNGKDPSACAAAKAQFMEESLVANIRAKCIHTIILNGS